VHDVAIIGGGIVGLATAYHLSRQYPDQSVIVLEKEDHVAAHQTGRNSGVIHSGIYYTPGSLKAKNCREGKRRLQRFCAERDVDYEMCGKVIVAADESEIPGLREIERKGRENEIEHERIGPERLAEIEPYVRGVEALRVPRAGIVDYTGMAEAMAEAVRERGHAVRTSAGVAGMDVRPEGAVLETEAGPARARHVVNCGGLYADRLAAMSGAEPRVQVVPFRGEYYELTPGARRLCNGLIYPVPDPAFPFLGVHFTKTVEGGVECGPSAVLAFAREGYLFGNVHGRELAEILSFPGFWRLAARHWKKGFLEIAQSLSTRYYLRALRHLIPAIRKSDLRPAAAGVRAQALTRSGELVDDFLITETERVVNVLNAASPAATASLSVGEHIGERLARRF
jgi:L-2-hydroxyglutarate oxidase